MLLRHAAGYAAAHSTFAGKSSFSILQSFRVKALLCAGGGGLVVLAYKKESAECAVKQICFLWGRGAAERGSSTLPENASLPVGAKEVVQFGFASQYGAAVDKGGRSQSCRKLSACAHLFVTTISAMCRAAIPRVVVQS